MAGYKREFEVNAAFINLFGREGAEEFVEAMNRSLTLEGDEFVREFSRLNQIMKDAVEELKERIANRQREFKRKVAIVLGVAVLAGAGIVFAAATIKMAAEENQIDQNTEE